MTNIEEDYAGYTMIFNDKDIEMYDNNTHLISFQLGPIEETKQWKILVDFILEKKLHNDGPAYLEISDIVED